MTDDFRNTASALDSPATNSEVITPSDSADLPFATRAIYIGNTSAGGDLRVTMVGGQIVTYPAIPQGTTKSIRVTRVWATGTTASSLIGEW